MRSWNPTMSTLTELHVIGCLERVTASWSTELRHPARWPRPLTVEEFSWNLFQLWQKLLAPVTAAERPDCRLKELCSERSHDFTSAEADAGEFQRLRGGNDPWTAIWSLELNTTFISLSKCLNAGDVEVESDRLILSHISRVGVEPQRLIANFRNYAIAARKVCFPPRFPRPLWMSRWWFIIFNENHMLTPLSLYSSATTEEARIRQPDCTRYSPISCRDERLQIEVIGTVEYARPQRYLPRCDAE